MRESKCSRDWQEDESTNTHHGQGKQAAHPSQGRPISCASIRAISSASRALCSMARTLAARSAGSRDGAGMGDISRSSRSRARRVWRFAMAVGPITPKRRLYHVNISGEGTNRRSISFGSNFVSPPA